MTTLLTHDVPTLALLHAAQRRYAIGKGPEYVRPKDVGGTATNARSQSLQRLVALGLAEKQPRDCILACQPLRARQVMRGRVTFEYRITARGIEVAERFSTPGGGQKSPAASVRTGAPATKTFA